MEDVSLKYLDPLAYREIEDDLASRSNSSKQFIEDTKALIRSRVEVSIPDVYIEGRVKSVYGIYRKMFIQGKAFDEIYDVFAVRVIVDTIEDCYNRGWASSTICSSPCPTGLRTTSPCPKPNMYQSLHTTVITKAGVPFEVQIRTWEMHHTAEYGIAAHWKYKLGMSAKDSDKRRPGRPPGLDSPDAGKPGRKRGRHRLGALHQKRPHPRGGVRVHPQRGRHQLAAGLHRHRLCLRHTQRRGQPDDWRQGGQAHRPPGL